jgi:predicted transcriptional regulator
MFLKKEQEKNILVSYHHVGKHFKISKVTTKKRLDLLENKGLISIHEKGRMKIIKLTSKGETLLNKREVL